MTRPPARRVLAVTLAAAVGLAATLALGAWQMGRAAQKLALHDALLQRASLPALSGAQLASAQDIPSVLHRAVQLQGQWLPEHTVYLDNRQMNGKVGFYVATPLRLEGSGATVLVQRGWAQRSFTQREQLPPVQTPAGAVQLHGRIAPPPAKLYELGSAQGGAIRQNLDLAGFRTETRLPLLEVSVQQTDGASDGLLREWPEAASGVEKNYGYAIQWWALSVLIAILYVWFQFVAPRRKAQHA